MKKLLKNRVLPIVCAVSILASVCSVSAFSAFDPGFADTGSVMEWESEINSPGASLVDVIAQRLGVGAVYTETFWGFVDSCVTPVGSVSQGDLEGLCSKFNATFNRPVGESFFSQLFEGSADIYSNTISALYLGNMNLHFEIQQHPASGFYRIKETTTDIWVVNSVGYYPYYESIGDGETEAGDQWIGETTAQDRSTSGTVAIHTLDRINLICNRLKNEGLSVKLKTLNDASGKPKYQGIWYNRQFYADPNGNPYVAPYNSNEWASNQDRPDTTVKDENGDEIEGLPEDNTSGIDLENMLIYLPNGSIGVIDNLIYDESTKTYNIDSHDTYNTTTNYYYHWEYHINYTSITYIGQTEEYNKYYEVYYELPDGRDSADLTKEDLEQLNLSVDVIPYGRSADDTSLRSLYHFDGDTKDASYWNYCTEFTWNKGASLTYMDAGVFDGALYLDETEHDFTLTLPSMISTGDFTFQFRYYQSHTEAPQTDSSIKFGSTTLLKFNGASILDSSGNVISTVPIGTWNEIALIRSNGVRYTYLNGVKIASKSDNLLYSNTINFCFGADQQTYKYLDELRVLNYAIQTGGANYECTSVPHDTNLTLVLPDSSIPLADEYVSITEATDGLLLSYDFTADDISSFFKPYNQWDSDTPFMFTDNDETYYHYYTHEQTPEGLLISRSVKSSSFFEQNGLVSSYGGFRVMRENLFRATGSTTSLDMAVFFSDLGCIVFHMPYSDSAAITYTIHQPLGMNITTYKNKNGVFILRPVANNGSFCIRRIEILEPGATPSSMEFVSSVTVMDKEDLNTPTLAVRTGLEITSYQIGGVRPSLPTKGQVWAMVENERIVSIQIYNGQAWEGVDGRMWTGSRWIPASSYNIITLQDMYDIVDATQDFEYIYSESGFWAWWQKSWNAFTERLFTVLGSGGTGSGGSAGATGGTGSSVMDGVDLDAEDAAADPEQEDSKSLWQFVVLVISGGKSVVGGVRHMFSGVVSEVPDTVDNITDALDPGGIAVGFMDGSSSDPDSADLYVAGDVELAGNGEVDPWRYR